MPPIPIHFEEIHLLNQVFIPHPFHHVPEDICPREEIAAPDKLATLVRMSTPLWDDITIVSPHAGNQQSRFKKLWVSDGKCYHEGLRTPNFVEAICYYVLCQNERLFSSARAIPTNEPSAILQWLREWGNEHFLITTSLMMYHGYASDIMFGVSHGLQNMAVPLLFTFDTAQQLIHSNCFTVGNGLILALALERAGVWNSASLHSALRQWLPDYIPYIQPDFIPFYTQHTLPHISEYPTLYACMGHRPSSHGVFQALQQYLEVRSVVQYFDVFHHTAYTTSHMTAAFPYFRTNTHGLTNPPMHTLYPVLRTLYQFHFPQGFFLDDSDDDSDDDDDADAQPEPAAAAMHQPIPAEDAEDAEDEPMVEPPSNNTFYPDISGFLLSVLSQPSTWRWWNTGSNSVMVIRAFNAEFADIPEALTYVFKRLFHLFESGTGTESLEIPRSRIQTLWRQWMAVIDPNGEAVNHWLTKYLFGRHLREKMLEKLPTFTPFGQTTETFWNPAVPFPFLKDLLTMYPDTFSLYRQRTMQLLTRRWDEIAQLYPEGWVESIVEVPDVDEPRRKIRIRFSIYKVLAEFKKNMSPEYHFKMFVDRRAITRLSAMNRFFMVPEQRKNEEKYALVWDMMKEYYRKNRMELIK